MHGLTNYTTMHGLTNYTTMHGLTNYTTMHGLTNLKTPNTIFYKFPFYFQTKVIRTEQLPLIIKHNFS